MIGSITGTIIAMSEQSVIIDTKSGVGYAVFTDTSKMAAGSTVSLFTHHHIREDANLLYGFAKEEDIIIFELLLTVSGVGPKMALNLQINLGNNHIRQAIASNQPAIFRAVSGVGQKVAEKIIVELKNKVGQMGEIGYGASSNELTQALLGLGYKPSEIQKVIPHLTPGTDNKAQLKEVLRLLSK